MAPTELLLKSPSNSIRELAASHRLLTDTSASPAPSTRQDGIVAIHCSGQDFLARAPLATIFLRRALDVLAHDDYGMVPLLHTDGLELLLITPATAASCFYDGQSLAKIKAHWDAQLSQMLDTETRQQ